MESNPYRSPFDVASSSVAPPAKAGLLQNHFGKGQLLSLLGIWAAFTALTYRIADGGIDRQPDHNRLVLLTTCATPLGPMTGAISRSCQSCCLSNSLSLLPYCGAFLAIGTIFQFIKLPVRRGAATVRLTIWVVGLLGWFLGGIVSFAHALN